MGKTPELVVVTSEATAKLPPAVTWKETGQAFLRGYMIEQEALAVLERSSRPKFKPGEGIRDVRRRSGGQHTLFGRTRRPGEVADVAGGR
jgi:hypothetical protein